MDNSILTENKLQIPAKKQGRNGLLELYRFLFALWVVYYHGFFITKGAYFNHGYISVEFFFILSGFFLISSFKKLDAIPTHTALFKLIWSRIKSLGVAFPISLIFVVWYMFLDGEISFFGYMWYISIGIMLSYIPKYTLKIKKFNLNYIIVAINFAIIFYLAYLPKANLISEYSLVFLLLPALIYFTSTVTVNSGILNFLGSMSFGLYAYQCILRVFELYITTEKWVMFCILLTITLIDSIFLNYKKANKGK